METVVNPAMLSGELRDMLANLITSFLQMEKERKKFRTILMEFIGKVTSEKKAPASVILPLPPRAVEEMLNPHLTLLTKGESQRVEPKKCNGVIITDDLKVVLDKLARASVLNAEYKPIGLSLTGRAMLASVISKKLWKRNDWKFFEKLWGMKNLSASYYKAVLQVKSNRLKEKFEKIIK